MGTQDKEQEAIYDDASSSCSLTPSQQADEDDDIREDIGGCLSRQPLRALQSRASFLSGRQSNLSYFWEVANAHQILQSLLQRLNNKAGAVDASRALISSRSTTTSNNSSGGQSRGRQQQDDKNNTTAGSSLIPLVESIKELAECQRQMVFDRVEDRNHE
jgi:hypothetical protein